MSQAIPGHFYEAGSSVSISAIAYENKNGSVNICRADDQSLIRSVSQDDYELSLVIPSVPVELCIRDGAVFQPHDRQFRWQTIQGNKLGWMAVIESNPITIISCVIILPILLWWLITDAIPNTAEKAVDIIPYAVVEQIDTQAFAFFEKALLEDSRLEPQKQEAIRSMWLSAMNSIGVPGHQYELHFRHSDSLGANAFALPGGTVVVTDDLVELLESSVNQASDGQSNSGQQSNNGEDALLAVLLHEVAHVEHQHGLRLLARSTATTLFFAIFLGDIEGAGELILGVSSSFLDNAFSRDMESEADLYAMDNLQKMGKSSEAFAQAMEAFLSLHDDTDEPSVMRYLSTHPSTQERIDRARARAQVE